MSITNRKKKLYCLLLSRLPITNGKLKTHKNPHSQQKQVSFVPVHFYSLYIFHNRTRQDSIDILTFYKLNRVSSINIVSLVIYVGHNYSQLCASNIVRINAARFFLISAQKSGERQSLSVQFHLISGGNATDSS